MAVNEANDAKLDTDVEAAEAAEPEVVADEQDAEAQVIDDQVQEDEAQADQQADNDLAEQLADVKDKYVRLQAEWDNYRKRTAAERAQERSRATERLVTNLLPIIDDMERAIDNAGVDDNDPMLAGIKAVHAKFTDVLKREGLEAVAPQKGDPLDIHHHQAVSTVEDPSVPAESIGQVYQKGYVMGDKILRPAMVVTTTGGPKRPKEDADK